jgi:hypothetical protein
VPVTAVQILCCKRKEDEMSVPMTVVQFLCCNKEKLKCLYQWQQYRTCATATKKFIYLCQWEQYISCAATKKKMKSLYKWQQYRSCAGSIKKLKCLYQWQQYRIQDVGMFTIYFYTKYHMPNLRGSLFISIKPSAWLPCHYFTLYEKSHSYIIFSTTLLRTISGILK